MVELRLKILRKPLGLGFTQEELDGEKNELLIVALDDDEVVGCCMLVHIDDHTLRLRQMAVDESVQLKGVGASILHFAENLARDKGYRRMIMHARITAIGFYEKFGFQVIGPEFNEVNLPHRLMEKTCFDQDCFPDFSRNERRN